MLFREALWERIRSMSITDLKHRIANFIRNSVFVLDQALLKAEACHAERMISECISLFAFRKSYQSLSPG